MISQRRAHELQPDPAVVGAAGRRTRYMESTDRAKKYALEGGAEPAVRRRLAKMQGQRDALNKMMQKVTGT